MIEIFDSFSDIHVDTWAYMITHEGEYALVELEYNDENRIWALIRENN